MDKLNSGEATDTAGTKDIVTVDKSKFLIAILLKFRIKTHI